jgi:hypothetical protein
MFVAEVAQTHLSIVPITRRVDGHDPLRLTFARSIHPRALREVGEYIANRVLALHD